MNPTQRIGLSIPVTGVVCLTLVEINRVLVHNGFGREVTFGVGGTSAPHLTVAMGTLRLGALSDLEGFAAEAVLRASQTPVELPLAPQGPNSRGYVVVPTLMSAELTSWRQSIQKLLQPFFHDFGPSSEAGHITVAHTPARLSLPRLRWESCSFDAEFLDIAVAGIRGRKEHHIRRLTLGA